VKFSRCLKCKKGIKVSSELATRDKFHCPHCGVALHFRDDGSRLAYYWTPEETEKLHRWFQNLRNRGLV
jgi:predicted RNA-binding Zn-ribbon protein involved in translation (DUF1610 family)